MRQVQIVLTAAVLVMLSVIAWQLHQIDRELQSTATLSRGIVQLLERPVETRAQRNERLQRNQQELEEDVKAILATPEKSARRAPTRTNRDIQERGQQPRQ